MPGPEADEGKGVVFAFADTCSTITSGAMVGRTGFKGDLLYSVGVTGFIYPIIGHWAWGPDGFLATMGSAGSSSAGGATPTTVYDTPRQGSSPCAGCRLFQRGEIARSTRSSRHAPARAPRATCAAHRIEGGAVRGVARPLHLRGEVAENQPVRVDARPARRKE